jgi:hypothetical protein
MFTRSSFEAQANFERSLSSVIDFSGEDVDSAEQHQRPSAPFTGDIFTGAIGEFVDNRDVGLAVRPDVFGETLSFGRVEDTPRLVASGLDVCDRDSADLREIHSRSFQQIDFGTFQRSLLGGHSAPHLKKT